MGKMGDKEKVKRQCKKCTWWFRLTSLDTDPFPVESLFKYNFFVFVFRGPIFVLCVGFIKCIIGKDEIKYNIVVFA